MNNTGPRLLLVQSASPQREQLLDMLNGLGCVVEILDDESAVVADSALADCDVALVDIQRNGTLGHDLLVALSGHRENVPVIVVCRDELMKDALDALRHGACDYIKLPVADVTVLQHALRRALQQTFLKRENAAYRAKLEAANRELLDSLTVLQTDQQAGRHIQLRMLPESPKQIGEFRFDHRVVPSLFLSGDFVEYFGVGDTKAAFFIADVSGHGASSAFVTVMLKNLFARKRSSYKHNGDKDILSPAAMLRLANDELLAMDIGKHVTMVVGVLDVCTGECIMSVAGHLPAPVLSNGKTASYIGGQGVAVGLFEDAEFTEQQVNLDENSVLTLFSDGILEIMPGDGVLEQESILLERLQGGYKTADALREALDVGDGDAGPDDIAALLICRA